MAKTYFELVGGYEGLRTRRLNQIGRVVLYEVISDPPPYWLLMIRNFNRSEPSIAFQGNKETGINDQEALKGITTPWGNAVWRFTSKTAAKTKFNQIASLITP